MAITIREFGVLTATGASCGLDAQCLADADFALLKQEALAGQPYLSLISRAGNECVRVGSHVGVIVDCEQFQRVLRRASELESKAQTVPVGFCSRCSPP